MNTETLPFGGQKQQQQLQQQQQQLSQDTPLKVEICSIPAASPTTTANPPSSLSPLSVPPSPMSPCKDIRPLHTKFDPESLRLREIQTRDLPPIFVSLRRFLISLMVNYSLPLNTLVPSFVVVPSQSGMGWPRGAFSLRRRRLPKSSHTHTRCVSGGGRRRCEETRRRRPGPPVSPLWGAPNASVAKGPLYGYCRCCYSCCSWAPQALLLLLLLLCACGWDGQIAFCTLRTNTHIRPTHTATHTLYNTPRALSLSLLRISCEKVGWKKLFSSSSPSHDFFALRRLHTSVTKRVLSPLC